jgi:probable DNA metabolism protein
MMVYVYDGSFEGILTAVFEAYVRRERPALILPAQNLATNLLDRYEDIVTAQEKCDKIVQAIRTKISEDALHQVSQVYLADFNDPGTLIYNYLRLGFRLGAEVDNHLHESCVFDVHAVSRKVSREVHRFEGLLRFVKTEWGIYYAKLEPDHNIAALLAPHFAARLSDQNWIIHDTKRGIAVLFNRQEWIITDNLPEALTNLADSEALVQDIWRQYFQSIAIAERKNSKLQKNLMPTRYWKNLTEINPG